MENARTGYEKYKIGSRSICMCYITEGKKVFHTINYFVVHAFLHVCNNIDPI